MPRPLVKELIYLVIHKTFYRLTIRYDNVNNCQFIASWTISVKVVLMPSGQVTTLRCLLSQTITELKEHFSSEHKLPIDILLLMCDGNKLENNSTVADLGVGPNGTIQLELQSGDPVNLPIKILKPRQEYTMPDVITVRVQSGERGNEISIQNLLIE